MIPPYFNNQQFQDDLDDIARKTSYTARTDEEILKMVVDKAANAYDIKLNDKQVVVSRTANGVAITVKYQVHVDMILHPVDLDFTANSLNKRL
jgi:Fe-S cluster assembly scaffold protein SufB